MDFSKHFEHQRHKIVRGFLLLALVIIINLLSYKHFFRIDLTADNKFTLSKSTENLIQKANDVINIKFYLSDKLPPDLNTRADYVKDILNEYSAISNGNIKISYLDPISNPSLLEETSAIGIPQIQMEILEKDKYQVQNGYFGIAIFYGNKTEIIPVIQNLNSLEYDITSRIKKVYLNEFKKIGFLSNVNGYDSENGYTRIASLLKENYEVENIDLQSDSEIAVDTIIVGGPKKDLSQEVLNRLDQFIKEGGKVIFLIDTIDVGNGLIAQPLDQANISDYLANRGILINNDLIYDQNHENASFSQGFISYILPYPLWPKFLNENFDKDNIIVNSLSNIVMPWVNSLDIKESNLKLTKLIQSSQKADHFTENFDLNPQQQFVLENPKKFTTAILAEGQTDDKTKFIVISDSDFISDQFIDMFPANSKFILNTVDYLTLDSDLIQIRSKNLNDNPLKKISDKYNIVIKNLGTFLSPILLVIYGVQRTIRRRKKAKNLI